MLMARRTVWAKSEARVTPRARRDSVEKTIDAPTRKRKVGKTRSVGVNPFHSACFEAGPMYTLEQRSRCERVLSARINASEDTWMYGKAVKSRHCPATVCAFAA